MKKTKIICTLGPSTSTEEIIKELIVSGMNVARFNFSHGTHKEHLEKYKIVETVRREMNVPIATLLDTKGPEVRLKKFENQKATIKTNDIFILTTEDVLGNEKRAAVTYSDLPKDVKTGNIILLDDGLIELEVQKIIGNDIHCLVINGGVVKDNKGVNIPDVKLSLPFISEQDKKDILFGIETGFDFVAASFVSCADDVKEMRTLLDENGGSDIKIIAKIENSEGVKNVGSILSVADGVMIARGDMGVEIPQQNLPAIQKHIIKIGYEMGKIVITATQMLESMINNPRPTRAETSDIANAIYDGTSAIMLSGETAAGKYPVDAVRTMATIAKETEKDIDYKNRFYKRDNTEGVDITNAISHATCTTAYDLDASAIVTVTRSGHTARMVSKYRPAKPIIGCSYDERVYRQMALSWGVIPVHCDFHDNTDELFDFAVKHAENCGVAKSGELVVITAGVPLGIPGTTNILKVQV
ncbi:MAG: pyruvate kinase, partial [Oscillospiraceae bacterium]